MDYKPKTGYMKSPLIKLLLVGLLTAGLAGNASAEPGLLGRKKKKEAAAAAAAAETTRPKKKTAYEKIVEGDGVIVSKSDFISTYIQGGKLYFEIPTRYLGREMLLGTLTSQTSSPGYPDQGNFTEEPFQVMFVLRDSTVYLEKKNTSQIRYPEGENYVRAMERNFLNEIFRKFKVEAYNSDSSAVLINVTDLFLKDVKELSPWGKPATTGTIYDAKLNDANTTLLGTKTFDDNLMVETDMSYTVSRRYRTSSGTVDMGTADYRHIVKRSLKLLPEEKMHPREADRRIGIFLIPGKRTVSVEKDFMEFYSLAIRWRVEPSDTAAWLRGELVEPVKPIVWYVDDAFPEEWREPIHNGVLRWNKAFERIGFKNVMVVRDFPQDDPEFDPDNLKYSCIRYIPSTTGNAYGPSWCDQDTGEILNASVVVYSDITSLNYSWRVVQTGQADPSVRAGKLPKEVLDESLEYVIAHEIGHTLGFMHNMSASAAYPVDSLRSPTFTAEYGTTPSIMDYARFNYVAQPGDGVTNFGPPELGPYDYHTVRWLYEPIIGKTEKEEKAILEGWLDEKEGDPVYHYGVQQIHSYYDPRSLREDLGDDPIRASDYGIANLKYILPQLHTWIDDDPNNLQKNMVYEWVQKQYMGYLDNVFMLVGGIKINNVKDGPGVTRFEPVTKARQKEAMTWLVNQLRDVNWINDTPIRYNYALSVDPSMSVLRWMMTNKLMNGTYIGKVVLCSHISDDPYTLREYADDLYALIFSNSIRGRKLTEGDKFMQKQMVERVKAQVKPQVRGFAGFGPDTEITLEQLRELVPDEEYEMVAYEMHGGGHTHMHDHDHQWCSSPICLGNDTSGRTSAYGYQTLVNVDTINEWNALLVGMAPQLETLLRSRLNTAHPDDRAHYRMLLNMIQKD